MRSFLIKNNFFYILCILFFSSLSQAWVFSPAEVNGEIAVSNGSRQITILNNSGSSQALSLSVAQAGASISLNRCNGTLANNRSCNITISINSALMPSGTTVFPLLNNGTTTLTSFSHFKAAPVESSNFSQTSVSISDFVQKTISITNKTLSSKSYSPTFSGTDASKFQIVLNRCTNISPNSSCQITYKLLPQQAGNYSAQMTEPQVAVPVDLSAIITGSTSGVVVPSVSSISLSVSSLNFGTLSRYGLSSPQTIVVTNTGNTTVSPIIQLSPNMGIALNRCSSILAGQSCSLSVGVNPPTSMPNGVISGESVIVKKNGGDTGLSVSISASLNVVVVCAPNQHYEAGSCVSNTRSCSISNGIGTQSWVTGAWSSCSVVSCNSGYYSNANTCSLITYSATLSDYSPTQASLLACDGTVTASRTVISCMRDDNFQIVPTSNCVDLAASTNFQSPAGNKTVSISNGSEVRSCPVGSNVQTFVSRTCDSNYHDNGTSCQATVYVPMYSLYNPAIPTLNACDGSIVSTRTISQCNQQHDNAIVSNSLCTDPTPTVTTQSPAGNKTVSIANGSEVRSCVLGSSTETFVSRTCDSGYFNNGSACQAITYVPTYSNHVPSISGLNTCDGTVTSVKTLQECRQQHDNALVSNSLCPNTNTSITTDSPASFPPGVLELYVTVNVQSPAGNKTFSISNGSEVRSCPIGSNVQTFVSRTCNSGFYNDGSSCQAITYVPTYSLYNPEIPTLNACGGTVVSTRTISQCNQQHDNAIVSNSLCTDPTPSVTTQSPAGDTSVSIPNGSEIKNCAAGSNVQTFVSRTCNAGYTDNGTICSSNIVAVEMGGNSAYILNSAGRAYFVGTNGWGLIGNGSTAWQYTPAEPSYSGVLAGKTIKAVAIGPKHTNHYNTVVIGSDNLAYSWGSNLQGSLGIGNTTQQNSPVAVDTTGVLAGKTILKIATAMQNTCVIASDNKVYCWGRNGSGELGIGATTPANSTVPVSITSSSALFSKVATDIWMGGSGSSSNTCVRASDGLVYCWGENANGSTCSGGGTRSTPTVINASGALAGKTIIKIEMLGTSTFIHTSDGKLYGCGANSLGQLGINSTTGVSLPTEIVTTNFSGSTISKVSNNDVHSCLLASNGFIYCWGQNSAGKTGLGLTTGNTILPTKVTLPSNITAIDVQVNSGSSYALGSDNKVYSWGNAAYGMLGDGQTSTNASTPIAMVGPLSTLTTTKLFGGWFEFCALTNQNRLYCIGQAFGSVSTPALYSVP